METIRSAANSVNARPPLFESPAVAPVAAAGTTPAVNPIDGILDGVGALFGHTDTEEFLAEVRQEGGQ